MDGKELAYALMFETAPLISSNLFRELLLPSDNAMIEGSGSNKLLATSLRCLILLGDVMTLCLPSPEEKTAADLTKHTAKAKETSQATEWTTLLEGLWQWYSSRPREMQPLVEIDDDDNNNNRETTFPTILFTASVGISVNMSYHAAMFLLLSHWPSNIVLLDCFNSIGADPAQMSPTEHAHRVCGIAINSDPEHTKCWDPSMIASFALAARVSTLPSQRSEILSCLNIVRMAGWRVDGLVRRLRDGWT